MARPKIEIKLPNWYDLKKYEATKTNETACFWYEQLLARKRLITLLTIQDLPAQVRSSVLSALEIIRRNPIVDIDSSPLLKNFINDQEIIEIKSGKPNQSFGLRAITARNLYRLETRIPKEKRILARHHFDESLENMGKGFYTPKYQAKSWFNDPLNSVAQIFSNEACININLELTDKILIEQLRNFIPILRKQFGIDPETGKSRRPITSDDLYKYSILPYLDLEIWAYQKKLKITNVIMANAIFNKGTRGEDDIKISKKIAHNLIRESNLSSLAAQAALEILKQK